MEINPIGLLQKNKNKSINPIPVPSPLTSNLANFKPILGMQQQKQIVPTVAHSKNKLPPPMTQVSKPDPEQQLKLIIQNKPPKKDVIEYLQKRCNDLTIIKMK